MTLFRLECFLALFVAAVSPLAAAVQHPIYTFDARPLSRLDLQSPTNAANLWDTLHALSALQGLANRDKPQLYLFYCSEFGVDTDQFWFDWARQKGGWLAQTPVKELKTLEEAAALFRSSFRGLAVYDPAAPATSNLGSTAAGCEDLLPVRYDPTPGSVFDRLTRGMKLEVKLWLLQTNGAPLFTGTGTLPGLQTPSSGSKKVDAHLWALDRWVHKGKSAPGIAAYYIDAAWLENPRRGPSLHTLCNHDYFISRKAFFWDLSPWGDEAPGDDLQQPLGADKRAFLQVMRAIHDQKPGHVIKVGGFTPWPHKYTSESVQRGKHGAVETEWEFARLISQYNGYMEADAAGLSAMANASFFQHYPLERLYPQRNPKPDSKIWAARGYIDKQSQVAPKLFVGHYVGDYDAPSWLYKAVPKYFPHTARTPLGWAFNPNLADRAPHAMAYARANAGSNDWFIAGDSGAGYLNPRSLTVRPDSMLPSGLEAWTKHCRDYYRQWDLSITGFMLDGAGGASTEREFAAYRSFSPDGIGTHFEPAPAMKAGIPTCRETDLPDDPAKAAALIVRTAEGLKGKTGFMWCRSILKPPQWYDTVSASLVANTNAPVEIVDPYTFFGLVKLHMSR